MAIESAGISLGTPAPDFDLSIANPWVDKHSSPTRSKSLYDGPLVVIFTCNHCPYAIHIQESLVKVASTYMDKNIHFVAINSNDPVNYPDDSFDNMVIRAREVEFPFPYLFDETQEIAKSYKAACTPDLFVFDKNHTLVYSGRFDETRPGKGVAHGGDLKNALDALLAEKTPARQQLPSIGCSIKWKKGNSPDYF